MYKTTLQLILIGILIMLFNSCQTAKQLMDKAEKKNPAIVAEYARDKYPCTDLLKNDTAVIWKDTTIYVDCPDTARNNEFNTIRVDTVNNIITKTIKVPFTIPARTVYITKWYEDSAKLKLCYTEIFSIRTENSNLQTTVDKQKKKINRQAKELWIHRGLWIIILIIATLLLLRKFRII